MMDDGYSEQPGTPEDEGAAGAEPRPVARAGGPATAPPSSPEAAAAELLRRRFARNSLAEFAQAIEIPGRPVSEDPEEWLFKPVESLVAAHHLLLMDTLDRVFRREIRNCMVFMPPGSAKSTYTSVVYPAYAMGRRAGSRVILASYAAAIARKQSRRTRQIVRGAAYRPLFGASLMAGNQSVDEWALSNGSEYMAGGLLGGMTGNRATDLVIDDPVAGREDAESEVIRRKTREAYEDDLATRLVPGGATVIIQTRWHEDDLAGGILPQGWEGESGLVPGRDGQDWWVLCLPAIAERADDPLGRAPGERLWPEWFAAGHFDKFRANPRTWAALFQQRPRPSEGGEFRLGWLQRYFAAPPVLNRIILVDPAGGRRKDRGDYTCMWVVGLAPDRNVYVLDCVRDRLNLTERTATLLALHRQWRPLEVRYEQYGLQADIEAIRAEQERQQYRFRITEVGGAVKKEDRIRRLVPLFEHGRVYLPQQLPYRDSTGRERDLIAEFVQQEYAAFPVGRTDDMLDALARIAEPGLRLPWPMAEAAPGGEGWEPADAGAGY